jgi:hypothetical protein
MEFANANKVYRKSVGSPDDRFLFWRRANARDRSRSETETQPSTLCPQISCGCEFSGSRRSDALYQGTTLVGPYGPNKDPGFSP